MAGAQVLSPATAAPQVVPVQVEPFQLPPLHVFCFAEARAQAGAFQARPKMSFSPVSAVPLTES